MKKHLLIVVLQLVASGADAYYTDKNQHLPRHYELNPIARQFIGSRPSLIGYFGAQTALKLELPTLLRKRGHGRMAETVQAAAILDNASGATISKLNNHSVARSK